MIAQMRPTRYHNVYIDGAACFWTSGIVERVSVLRSPSAARALLSILDECRKRYSVRMIGYVVMPDHIHLVLWSELADNVKRFLERFLGNTSADIAAMTERAARRGDAKAARWLSVFKARARDGAVVRVWKERGRAFPVTRDDDLEQKLRYMHENPVRAGLAERAEDWEFSSASWYSTGTGPIEVDELPW
jgi:putative transposase